MPNSYSYTESYQPTVNPFSGALGQAMSAVMLKQAGIKTETEQMLDIWNSMMPKAPTVEEQLDMESKRIDMYLDKFPDLTPAELIKLLNNN